MQRAKFVKSRETGRSLLKTRFKTASIYCTICCCFFIPFSSALMGTTAVLAFVMWVLAGNFLDTYRITNRSAPALLALFLFILLAFGIFYSSAPLDEAVSVLKKYRELLYFVMVYALFHDNQKYARLAETAFLVGCLVLLALSYAMYFSLIPVEKYGFSTVYHITHSFFMAVLAFWCLQRAFTAKKSKYLWFFILLLVSVNLFYIAPGRTGMLVFVCLVTVTFLQHLSWKKSLLAITAACLLLTGSFLTSDNFASRIKLAIQEINNYQPGAQKSRSSLGMRFDWWDNCIELIEEKPFFGHGTGSFKNKQGNLIKGTKTKATDNPHNEYLFLGVQVGLLGVSLFFGLLATLLFVSRKIGPPRKHLLQGVVVAMGIGCLMNSFLFDSHQGHFFAIISAILYADGGSEA